MQPIARRPKPPDDAVGFRPNPRFQRIYEAKLAKDVPTLINALADPDFRRTVARYLAGLGATEAIPEIRRLLQVSDPDTRSAAARALGQLSASAAVPELVEIAQHDPSTVTRSWVIAALGQIGDSRAKDSLERILAADEEIWLRRSAASALATTGERSSIPILRRASRREPVVRRLRYHRAIRAITRRHRN
jgi:HEAT repeat protein